MREVISWEEVAGMERECGYILNYGNGVHSESHLCFFEAEYSVFFSGWFLLACWEETYHK